MRPHIFAQRMIAALIVFFLLTIEAVTEARASNFIQDFIDASGGCDSQSAMLSFRQGSTDARTPYGKSAEEWSDDDLSMLRSTMMGCIKNPNNFDMQEERGILRDVQNSVNRARRAREANKRNEEARAQLEKMRRDALQKQDEQRRIFQEAREKNLIEEQKKEQQRRQESEAAAEVDGFFGHVMKDAEVERAGQIKEEFPSLGARIDGLIAAQNSLKEEDARARKQEEEKEATIKKIEAERRKQALAEQRAQEEQEIAQEKRKQEFEDNLPAGCKESRENVKAFGKPMQDKIDKAMALAEAGDTTSSCIVYTEASSKLEHLRESFLRCSKELDNRDDDLARDASAEALTQAIDVHKKQNSFADSILGRSCR